MSAERVTTTHKERIDMPEFFTDFYIFYAPFLVLIAAIIVAFFIAPKDAVIENGGQGRKAKRKKKDQSKK